MGATVTGGVTQTGGVTIEAPLSANLIWIITTERTNNLVEIGLRGTVNVTIDWGDGTSNFYNAPGVATHVFPEVRNYKTSFSGSLTGFFFNANIGLANANISEIRNWGNLGLTDLSNGFYGEPIKSLPNNFPSTVTNCKGLFDSSDFSDIAGNIALWNMANVTDMSLMFSSSNVTSNLSGWNVSNVSNMQSMFDGAASFNSNIASWNVSKVQNMNSMFRSTTLFNQNIGNWNVSNVTTMANMFNNADGFNQDLSNWCVTNITSSPSGFSTGTAAWTKENRLPLWGTCPTAPFTPATIQFISSANGTTTATLGTQQAGDLIVCFAFNNTGTDPTIPAGEGWTSIAAGPTGTALSYRVSTKYSNGSSTVGTWDNTDNILCCVYRNANNIANVGDSFADAQADNTNILTYANNAYYANQSWVVAFAAREAVTANIVNPPTGLTFRTSNTNTTVSPNTSVAAFDSNGLYGKFPTTTVSVGGANSIAWVTVTARLTANAA